MSWQTCRGVHGLGVLSVLVSATCLFGAGLSTCRATYTAGELTIANSHIERKWRVTNSTLYATFLHDIDSGQQWLAPRSEQPASRDAKFTIKSGKLGPVEAESLVAELAIGGFTYKFQVFPDASGVSVQLTGPSQSVENQSLENLDLAPTHLKLTQVRLLDQTDIHNELVFEDEWLLHPNEPLSLSGNLFRVEDSLTGNGFALLKEAPLPHARPVPSGPDLTYESVAQRLHFLDKEGYRMILLTYSGGSYGFTSALQKYQRQLRVFSPDRDSRFLTNTWGDRSRDTRINAGFMSKEIAAGARLGVDVIQIDDGWQKGRTANSAVAKGVWNGFWAADPQFWEPDPIRFPGGLVPVVQLASRNNMQFGLWFAPDSSNDFGNWEKDAAKLLDLHRNSGINYFKIDGVKATTKPGERNLRRFFDRILTESKGEVRFDLDVTAEIRPGYFGMINVGPVFVENRYTDSHRYWPHQTLRNLWKLSHYIDPIRLRTEFLNNARNSQKYADDPLQPSAYSPAYLFATVMFASPLGWFETSNLPSSYFEQLAPLVTEWKRQRPALFSGTILPIGEAPDGVSWTGFVSVAADRHSGYALIFHEASPSTEWSCSLPMFANAAYRVTKLGGAGSATLFGGALHVNIPEAKQFLWVKLDQQYR